jgi:hypothetical protein
MTLTRNRSKFLVLAGSYHEYLEWRNQTQQVNSCQFIESLEDIEGHIGYGVEVILYGTYKSNPLFKTSQFQALLGESQSPFSKYIRK